MKRILSLFLAAVILISSVTVSLMLLTSAESSQNLITNPGFESGLEGWTLHNGAYSPFNAVVVDTDKHEGTYSMHRYVGGGTENIYNQVLYTAINLKEGSRYNLKFWIKGDPAWGRFYISDNMSEPNNQDSMILHNQWQDITFPDWTEQTFTFKSPETKTYILCFYIAAPAGDIYLDDFSLVETASAPPADEDPDNAIKNGGFEKELENWVLDGADTGKEVNAKVNYLEKHSGENSLRRWNTEKSDKHTVYQNVSLEPNSDYKLSFYLKGNPAFGRVLVGTNKEKPYETSGTILNKQISSKYNDWKKFDYTFTTDEQTDYMFVLYFNSKNADVYIDDVSIKKVGGNLSNPGFENDLEGWEKYNGSSWTAFDGNVVDTEKHKGACSFHRVVKSDKSIYNQILYTPLKLKENTSYTLSFWMKGNPGWGRFYITEDTKDYINNNGKTLINNQWTNSFNEWTKVSYTFVTRTTKEVILCFYFSSPETNIYLDDFSLIENDRTNLVANGSFQYKDGGWELEDAFNVNAQMSMDVSKDFHKKLYQTIGLPGGNMKADFDGWLNQTVTLQKDKTYSVSVDAFVPASETSGCDLEFAVGKDINDIIAGNGTLVPLSSYTYGENYWQSLTGEFVPDSSLFAEDKNTANVCVAIRSKSKNAKLRIDNINVNNLLGNPDFETTDQKKVSWKLNNNTLLLSEIAQGMNYKFTFKYKGVGFEDNVAMYTLSTKADFDPVNTYLRGYVTEDAADWKEYEAVFNSGSNKSLELVFQSLSNDYSIDDLRISPTTEDVTLNEFKRAYSGDDMAGSYYERYKQPKDGKNIIVNDDFVGTSTGAYNDALEFIATSNGGESAGKLVSNGSEVGASYLGNTSLKFTAGQKEEMVLIPLSLKKNTEYFVGLYLKTGPYDADENGWTRFSYGIADTSSANYIQVEDNTAQRPSKLKFADRIQRTPRFDEEWHYAGFKFKTNDQDDLSFMLRGCNSTGYLDKLYIWEATSANTTDFLATLDKVGPVKNIKAEEKLLDISEEGKNLVDNSSFEQGTDFWAQEYRRVGVYGNNLNIVNSEHSLQKNTFLYENKLLYPWNCYYIQWIDVKPDTDYTFTAKYAITEPGDGYFGLIAGYKNDASVNEHSENMLYPSNGLSRLPGETDADMYISKWTFSEENYNEEHRFKTVGVTFNSGDRNRVGFYVQDGGGTAYIDDVKVFETQYAVEAKAVDDNFADSLVLKKDNVSLEESNIKGAKEGTELSELVASFENSKYIRFFDVEGNEITNLATNVKTGVEARLMNGPVIVDRATIIVAGDVNGDGKANETDSEAIIKHITMEQSLEGYYLDAADSDGDKKVTVYDALFNKTAYLNGTSAFTLDGPQNIGVGKDIDVTLIADVNDVFAISGILNFKRGALTFKSVKSNLDNWAVSCSDSSDSVDFAAVNSNKNNGTLKDKVVLTFTFTVGNIKALEDVVITLSDGKAATKDKLLILSESKWPKLGVEEDEIIEEEVIVETTEDKVVDNKPESDKKDNSSDKSENDYSYDDQDSNEDNSDESEETIVVTPGNRLSLLKLDEAEISPEFDPEIREYTATVPFEIEKVTVTAIPVDENATVEIGDTNLEYIGKNAVDIKVVSTDGLKRSYRIIVTREKPQKSSASDDAALSIWAIIAIIAGAALIVATLVFLIIILKKKRKNKA